MVTRIPFSVSRLCGAQLLRTKRHFSCSAEPFSNLRWSPSKHIPIVTTYQLVKEFETTVSKQRNVEGPAPNKLNFSIYGFSTKFCNECVFVLRRDRTQKLVTFIQCSLQLLIRSNEEMSHLNTHLRINLASVTSEGRPLKEMVN